MERIRHARPSVEIETIEVLRQPALVLKYRILMLPTIIIGDSRWHDTPTLDEVLSAIE